MTPQEIEKMLADILAETRAGNQTHEKAMKQVELLLAEGGDLAKLKGAVTQLEAEQKAFSLDTKAKLDACRRQAFDGLGNYKGVWGSEALARSVGLWALGTMGGKGACKDALKREFPDIYAHAFGADGSTRAMGEATNEAGGGLVPPEFIARLIRLVEDFGVFEGEAFNMPMSSDTLTFIRRRGGVQVFLVGENVAGTDSTPKYQNINLTAKKWGTLTYFPTELEEDSAIPVAELLGQEIAYAFAYQMDLCGFIGDGSSTYLGVTGLTTALVSKWTASGGLGLILPAATTKSWSTITRGDLLKVAGSAPQLAGANNKWFCSRNFFWNVMANIILGAGGVTAAEVQGKRELMFAGDVVRITQVLPKASAAGVQALYGDIRLAATVGRRRVMQVRQSREYKFAEDQVTVLGIQRVAVNVHDVGVSATEATAIGGTAYAMAGPVVGLYTTS